MELVTVGLDCKRAPVEVREKLAFPHHRLEDAYKHLLTIPIISESAILSTCNRVELYVLSAHAGQTETFAALRSFLGEYHEIEEVQFEPYLFYLTGQAAAQHLFEVASGIQSMVVGETQIQGQVREAGELSRKHGGAGRVLDAFFRAAISTGKRARTETTISESGVSVSFAAIELLEHHMGSLEGKTALVIGAGKTGRLTGQILLDKKISQLTFINRDLDHARETARLINAVDTRIVGFEGLDQALAEADIVIGCTAAPDVVVTRAHVEAALAGRENRPIFMVDIAVPRDIDPETSQVAGCQVWDIDDINGLAEANLARRGSEVGRVQAIVQEELDNFMAWMGALAIVPTITTLRRHADSIRKAELNRTMHALGEISDREARLLEDLTSRIINKLLHEPTLRLKEASSSDAGRYAEVVRYLFSLQGVSNEAN